MKQFAALLIILSSIWSLPFQANAQQPPEVVYEQGKIIGSLPYGRHFYIIGNSKLPNGAPADKVAVEIWDTGNLKLKRTTDISRPSAEVLQRITGQPPIVEAEWNASKALDTDLFKVYINKTLKVRTQYFVRISFYKNFIFQLSEEEKNEILLNTTENAFTYYRSNNEIDSRTLSGFINQQTKAILQRKLNLDENQFLAGSDRKRTDVLPDVTFDKSTLDDLATILGRMSSKQNLIEQNNKTIAFEIKPVLDQAPEGSEDFELALEEQRAIERQTDRLKNEKDSLRLLLLEELKIIKKQLVRVSSEFSIVQPEDYSVAELDAVNIGTSFGAAVVGLNFPSTDDREFEAFGYTALKFHFMPVDKRINDPYLDVFFISRLSFVVGVSFSNNFDYKGDELKSVIGFYPVLGLSYDVNRYFGFDLGATMFRQDSLSPLTDSDRLRVGPVIGLTLDIDLMNRFKSLFSSQQYLVNPTNTN